MSMQKLVKFEISRVCRYFYTNYKKGDIFEY